MFVHVFNVLCVVRVKINKMNEERCKRSISHDAATGPRGRPQTLVRSSAVGAIMSHASWLRMHSLPMALAMCSAACKGGAANFKKFKLTQ